MELPATLRQAVDAALGDIATADLAAAAQRLSERYRAEARDGALHVGTDLAARAYLATRLPATYAAISAVCEAVAQMRPDFAPRTLLDLGAGPGTAMWAAAQLWPLSEAVMIERSAAIRALGRTLAAAAPVARTAWEDADLADGLSGRGPCDLVVIGYVLNELDPAAADRLVDRSWGVTGDILVVVEPGTPAGWRRILRARERLLAAGGRILAPCPHAAACPLAGPDWCHFSRRVARSRLHRLAKKADVPWEDEKFSYLAVGRRPVASVQGRVIAPPRAASGRVTLKLCRDDGTATERLVTRREGAIYRAARRLRWGDAIQPGSPPVDARLP